MVEPCHESTTEGALRFDAADLATDSVVVYPDKAEVRRVLTVALPKGTNEIVIENVSAVIERESVRVDGKGVLIQEVQYQEMQILILEREKAIAENERFAAEDEISLLKKQIEVLDGVAGQDLFGLNFLIQMYNKYRNKESNLERNSLDGANPCGVNEYITFNQQYLSLTIFRLFPIAGETVSSMKRTLRLKQREWEQYSVKIEALERQIDHLRCGNEYDSVKRCWFLQATMSTERVHII
ncbi:unnamed protein product [Angiostrongylus costaricensis]|uniref:DUF4140 domain-containing protein n=1 Tax=Angiostrongylus costaricensis TaxID=334426 RepID=A0A0R3PAX5_ANGCS|nr:unnamed protein product [Angiostrongylus costaricensis]